MYVCLLDNAGVYPEHDAIVGSSRFSVYSRFMAVQHGHKYIDRDQRSYHCVALISPRSQHILCTFDRELGHYMSGKKTQQ